jgi:hypothetical protein
MFIRRAGCWRLLILIAGASVVWLHGGGLLGGIESVNRSYFHKMQDVHPIPLAGNIR